MTATLWSAALAALAVLLATPGGRGLTVPPGQRQRDSAPASGPVGWPSLRGGAAVGLLAAVAAALAGPVSAVLVVAAGVGVRITRRRSEAARTLRERRDGEVRAALVLAAVLRAGRDPAAALRAAAVDVPRDLAAGLTRAAALAGVGGDPHEALLATGSPVLRRLAVCWQVSHRTGIRLAPVVDRLAASVRADRACAREVGAALAGPRASARLLAVLPLVGLALGTALGLRPLQVLLGAPVGAVCLVVGVALDAVGLWWTLRLAASAERAGPA